jgi:hypothetical protein
MSLGRVRRPLRSALFVMGAMMGGVMAAPAFAGPLATEDAVVLERASCEWESTAARLSHVEEPQHTAWQTQLSCGTGARAQLSAAFGRSHDADDKVDAAGVGGKVRLWGGGEDQGALALVANINLLRVSDGAFRIRENSAALAYSQPLVAGLSLHANLGTVYDREAKIYSTTWNFAAAHDFNERFQLGAETFGDDRGTQWVSAGAAWAPIESATLFASYGTQVRGEGEKARLFSVGFTLAF